MTAMITMAAAGCGSASDKAATVPAQTTAVQSQVSAQTEQQTDTSAETTAETETAVQSKGSGYLPDNISVEYYVTNHDSYADDGTLLYIASFTRPQITITDNKAAQDKINAYMTEMEKAYMEQTKEFDKRSLESYKDYREVETYPYNNGYSKDKKWDENYDGYEAYKSVQGELMNDEFISFKVEDYEMIAGAANATVIIQGITFDAKTGDPIGLPDIFKKDMAGALTFIEGKVQEKLETQYKDVLFDDYKEHIGDFEAMNGGSDWYLTDEGFTAVLQETTVTAHYAGTIETTVPWSELKEFR